MKCSAQWQPTSDYTSGRRVHQLAEPESFGNEATCSGHSLVGLLAPVDRGRRLVGGRPRIVERTTPPRP